MDQKEKGLSTFLNHTPKVALKEGNKPLISPVYQSAKFALSDREPYGDQFIYSRVSNPTTRELELTLAGMQGCEDAIVYSSGVAAITNTLLGLLEAGDHVIHFRESYRPSRIFMKGISRFGMTSTMTTITDTDLGRHVVKGKTKLVYFESPANPHLQVADVRRLRAFCDAHKLLLIMDNTFAGPHQHHGFGIDLFIHSLTKYVNGHGDVIAGAVMGSAELIRRIKPMAITLGAGLDPNAAFLVQRGLRTFDLRYKRVCENALALTAFLRTHKKVTKVYFPDDELARSQMKDLGGVVSFEIDPSVGTAATFCHRLELAKVAVSLGSGETLVAPTEIFYADDMTLEDRAALGINGQTLRVALGIEDAKDIIADFEKALSS